MDETTTTNEARPVVDLLVVIGTAPATLPKATRTIELPETSTPEEYTTAAAALTSSDMRCVVAVAAAAATPGVLNTYVGLSETAGRLLDIHTEAARTVEVAPLIAAVDALAERKAPGSIDVAWAGNHPSAVAGAVVTFTEALDAQSIKLLVSAKVLTFAPPADVFAAFTQFVIIAQMRKRPTGVRWPIVDDSSQLVDLAMVSAAAAEARRQDRSASAALIADNGDRNQDATLMAAASGVPVEQVLGMLEARQASNGNWHCPRPERHNNGDATASAKVRNGKFRCYKCDGEDIDGLRLVMDSKAAAPFEAAMWIARKAAAAAANK